jgi:hypothetical protein
MPSITVTIAGLGRTKIISTSDYTARLLPALRYFNPDLDAVTHPAGTEPTVTTEGEPSAVIPPLVLEPATDEEIIQRWADRIIADLISSIEVYEDTKRVKTPLTLT